MWQVPLVVDGGDLDVCQSVLLDESVELGVGNFQIHGVPGLDVAFLGGGSETEDGVHGVSLCLYSNCNLVWGSVATPVHITLPVQDDAGVAQTLLLVTDHLGLGIGADGDVAEVTTGLGVETLEIESADGVGHGLFPLLVL